MIGLCGGINIFENAPALVSEPSREELLARSPDAILYGKSIGEKHYENAAAHAGLTAVREGRTYSITADYAYRPGPRLLLAAREICDALDRSRASMKAKAAR
jgi:iron complex transport system substrate-binding protein/vitamin B12 transport system substrate-binding protein